MRILLLTPCLFDRLHGGVQLSGAIAWDAIRKSNQFDSAMLCYGPSCAKDTHNIEPARRCASGKLTAGLYSLVERGRNDLVVVWHLGMLKLLPLIQTARSRIVLFLHGAECWNIHGTRTIGLLKRVDHFLVNSDFTWDRFIHLNGELSKSTHTVVPLGVGSPDPDHTAQPTGPYAVMVGRMCRGEDYKGHRQLIQAWAGVIARIPEAQLFIIGGGDQAPDLQALVKQRSLAGHVKFLGLVSDHEKNQIIRDSWCLALPSRGEGFGLVYLEAMRLGRPSLVSTLDAGQEVVNPPEAGLSVDPRNLEELTGAMVRLLTAGPEWDTWSRQARIRYEAQYTAYSFQQRLVLALQSIT